MGRNCLVCLSPDRADIDLDLADGISRRAIATQYGRSEASVRRHADARHQPAVHRAASHREALRLTTVVDRLVDLVDSSDAILSEAMGDGADRRIALAAIRESRETISMVTKIAGTADTADNLAEARLLVSALASVLPEHTAAGRALAHRLQYLGADDLATAVGAGMDQAEGIGDQLCDSG